MVSITLAAPVLSLNSAESYYSAPPPRDAVERFNGLEPAYASAGSREGAPPKNIFGKIWDRIADPTRYDGSILIGLTEIIPQIGLFYVLNKVGLVKKAGRATRYKIPVKLSPLNYLLYTAVIAPITEEIVFRGIPTLLYKVYEEGFHGEGSHWWFGVSSSIIFGLLHGFDGTGKLTKLGISQMIGGLVYWYLAQERGIDHAMVAHVTFNTELELLCLLPRLLPR